MDRASFRLARSSSSRGAAGLQALREELSGPLQTVRADAANPELAPRLLRELKPDLVVLAAGVAPKMAPLDEHTWESFSEAWSSDTQAAFHLVKAAVALPLPAGSTVLVVSSGAAVNGSHLSGGYAGAKRMQWLLADYAQQLSTRRNLGIRFVSLIPQQLIEGTRIGRNAAEAYGAWRGTSGDAVMKGFEVPLDAAGVAHAIVGVLRGDVVPGANTIRMTGTAVTAM